MYQNKLCLNNVSCGRCSSFAAFVPTDCLDIEAECGIQERKTTTIINYYSFCVVHTFFVWNMEYILIYCMELYRPKCFEWVVFINKTYFCVIWSKNEIGILRYIRLFIQSILKYIKPVTTFQIISVVCLMGEGTIV